MSAVAGSASRNHTALAARLVFASTARRMHSLRAPQSQGPPAPWAGYWRHHGAKSFACQCRSYASEAKQVRAGPDAKTAPAADVPPQRLSSEISEIVRGTGSSSHKLSSRQKRAKRRREQALAEIRKGSTQSAGPAAQPASNAAQKPPSDQASSKNKSASDAGASAASEELAPGWGADELQPQASEGAFGAGFGEHESKARSTARSRSKSGNGTREDSSKEHKARKLPKGATRPTTLHYGEEGSAKSSIPGKLQEIAKWEAEHNRSPLHQQQGTSVDAKELERLSLGALYADAVKVEKVPPLREMDVPKLAHGLDRVLFNPGVYWLRDPRSGIYNFDPRVRNVLDVDLFDYSTLPPYVTSSKDKELQTLAGKHKAKFMGSTSSLTGLLSQCYFLISAWRGPDLSGFSEAYDAMPKGFSVGAKLPASVKLTLNDGVYGIDADKEASGEAENSNYVLTSLGKSMEKMLTTTPEDYQRFTRVNSHKVSEEEKNKLESYHYARVGDLMMRSQLDCVDERLPRKTFDLKTRAVVAVRNDRANWVESSGYQIRKSQGLLESFEREHYDMCRAALLKYNFQARIGHMDGIFVCFHNTATVFGFQYLSIEEMNLRLFGSQEMADQSYKLCLGLLEKVLETATSAFPERSIKMTMETQEKDFMQIFVQPQESEDPTAIIELDVHLDRWLDGALVEGPVEFSAVQGRKWHPSLIDEVDRKMQTALDPVHLKVDYLIRPRPDLSKQEIRQRLNAVNKRQAALSTLILPNVDAINERERYRETQLASNPEALKQFLADRQNGVAPGMPKAPSQVGNSSPESVQAKGQKKGKGKGGNKEAAVPESELATNTPGQKDTRFRAARESTIIRLRQLSRLGAQDAAAAARKDPLKQYREVR